jgi:hypothetical protein
MIFCPVCDNNSELYKLVPEWGSLRRCTSCGLLFAEPMELPSTSKELFTKAYAGKLTNAALTSFRDRYSHRNAFLKMPSLALKFNTNFLALKWLKNNVPKGSCVMDIGCGVGYFLYALRQSGYDAMGIEPGELPANQLNKEGFKVWHGTVNDYPNSWPIPKVITAFYMLHHLPNPREFFSTIHQKFPNTPVIIGQYHIDKSSKNIAGGTLPPRALTHWTAKSLEHILIRAGYDVICKEVFPISREFGVPMFDKVYGSDNPPAILDSLIPLYLWGRRIAFLPHSFLYRIQGMKTGLFAIALPIK